MRYVELANAGARDVGFKDVSSRLRSNYDMPEDKFEAEVDRLWGQVLPFYTQLHCYMRRGLNKTSRRQSPAQFRSDLRAPDRQHVGAVLDLPL